VERKQEEKKKHRKREDETLPPVRRDKRATDKLRLYILSGLDELDDDLDEAIRDGD
jgi:hypothetical protein